MELLKLELTQWFTGEIQPHEGALRAYLKAQFPTLVDIDDLVQEAYKRVLHSKRPAKVRCPRAFLFATARNLALDLFRRHRAVPMENLTRLRELSVLDLRPNTAELVDTKHKLEILEEAIRNLPHRCREVMTLRYYHGLRQAEIAHKLGISTETVKTQLAKGIRRCYEHFGGLGFLQENRKIMNNCQR